jgi:hypothetical protein
LLGVRASSPRPSLRGGMSAEESDEDNPEEEQLFRDLWEDETQRDVVLGSLKADCEVRPGRPLG